MNDETPLFLNSIANWYDRYEELFAEALSLIDLAYIAGYTRVCWGANDPPKTWALGQWIIVTSEIAGYPILGSYDMGQPKDHGNKKRYQGYPPIPGRTLFL